MKHPEIQRVETLLRTVPERTLAEVRHPAPWAGGPMPVRLDSRIAGRGRMEVYGPYPGIEAAFGAFFASSVSIRHQELPAVLEIHHCRSGRVGWNMRDGDAVYLGPGDLTAHGARCCADSTLTFPLGYCESLTFTVDLERLAAETPEVLRHAGLDLHRLETVFCSGRPAAFPAGPELDALFAPLYAAPPERRLPWLKLKVQELLLHLDGLPPKAGAPAPCSAQQAAVIREIHALLTEHPDRRYTIEELSRRFLVNTSTLKASFKAVYGQPIAAYMREYRIRQAMRLLRETDGSIADIAAQVGYGSQGKFTRAFKDVAQTLPTAYRREHRR